MTTEIDEQGKRDLNAALAEFTREHDRTGVLSDSPVGNFIKGFYAARGWAPRERLTIDAGARAVPRRGSRREVLTLRLGRAPGWQRP